MIVATKPSAVLKFLTRFGVAVAFLMMSPPAETVQAQILESPVFSTANRSQLTATEADIPILPVYESILEAPLEGDYRLSCGAVADPTVHQGHYLRAPNARETLSKAQTATITVSYLGDGWTGAHGDSAKTAFERAVSTWETILTSGEEIRVDARFDSLAPNTLGSAGSCNQYCIGPFANLSQVDNTLLMGSALADTFVGDIAPGTCDITALFNNQFANFHFDDAPPPGGKFDFETIVSHELGHGLNFAGVTSVVFDTTWQTPDSLVVVSIDTTATFFRGACPAFLGAGTWNLLTEDGNVPAPVAAAKTMAAIGESLVDTSAYADPSLELALALFGQEGGVFFGDSISTDVGSLINFGFSQNGNVRPALYAPATWNPGSSFSHLDDATFDATTDNMMTHAVSLGEMGRGPGPVSCGMMADVGWTVDMGICTGLALPVELIAFEVTIVGDDGIATWTTATEDNNAGFEVEMRNGQGPWISAGFVEGAGRSTERRTYEFLVSELDYGRHTFRLKQIDFDGTSVHSYEVEAVKAVPDQFVLSEAYPNPFNPTTNFNLVVGRSQEVSVELFDISGRKVSTIMREEVGENEQRVVQINGDLLPSGVYVVRVTGDSFVANRRIVLLK